MRQLEYISHAASLISAVYIAISLRLRLLNATAPEQVEDGIWQGIL